MNVLFLIAKYNFNLILSNKIIISNRKLDAIYRIIVQFFKMK